ncbi:MAG: IS1 family transposase [Alphaproteobacteria bacterium]|nr:IS1 family transposase [Alphaproteobacteria bacterium]
MAVLPKKRHQASKKYTITIEQNNSNTRHYLGRMTRKTKIVSRSEDIFNASLNLLFSLSFEHTFKILLEPYFAIFN